MKPNPSLLPRAQREILALIEVCIDRWGYAPSIRELCQLRGAASTNGIAEQLSALQRKGFIHRKEMRARSIVVIQGAGVTA